MSDEIRLTWGFWPGLIIGTFCGLFVFGLAWIGQSHWDTAMSAGRLICETEFARHQMYLPEAGQ